MDRGGARPTFGWSLAARRGLSGLALVLAVALGIASRNRVDSLRVSPAPLPPSVVDLNTAPPVVLRALPRLGPVLVGRIVEERARAPFRSVAELDQRVRGIGPATVRAIRPHLRIGPTVVEPALATPRITQVEPVAVARP